MGRTYMHLYNLYMTIETVTEFATAHVLQGATAVCENHNAERSSKTHKTTMGELQQLSSNSTSDLFNPFAFFLSSFFLASDVRLDAQEHGQATEQSSSFTKPQVQWGLRSQQLPDLGSILLPVSVHDDG